MKCKPDFKYKNMIRACENGDDTFIKKHIQEIIARSHVGILCNGFSVATANGHLEITKLLAPSIKNPKVLINALHLAIEREHADIVRFLLPISNPSAPENVAFQLAVARSRTDIAD